MFAKMLVALSFLMVPLMAIEEEFSLLDLMKPVFLSVGGEQDLARDRAERNIEKWADNNDDRGRIFSHWARLFVACLGEEEDVQFTEACWICNNDTDFLDLAQCFEEAVDQGPAGMELFVESYCQYLSKFLAEDEKIDAETMASLKKLLSTIFESLLDE